MSVRRFRVLPGESPGNKKRISFPGAQHTPTYFDSGQEFEWEENEIEGLSEILGKVIEYVDGKSKIPPMTAEEAEILAVEEPEKISFPKKPVGRPKKVN